MSVNSTKTSCFKEQNTVLCNINYQLNQGRTETSGLGDWGGSAPVLYFRSKSVDKCTDDIKHNSPTLSVPPAANVRNGTVVLGGVMVMFSSQTKMQKFPHLVSRNQSLKSGLAVELLYHDRILNIQELSMAYEKRLNHLL